jgi:hypothetical protein
VPGWDELFRDRLRRAYESLDAADSLYFDRFEGNHAWSGRIAFPLFDEVLKRHPCDAEVAQRRPRG